MQALTCLLPDADPWTLQVGGLYKDGGGVQCIRRKAFKAVLRQPGRDGDLMLSFAGGCRTEKTRKPISISAPSESEEMTSSSQTSIKANLILNLAALLTPAANVNKRRSKLLCLNLLGENTHPSIRSAPEQWPSLDLRVPETVLMDIRCFWLRS